MIGVWKMNSNELLVFFCFVHAITGNERAFLSWAELMMSRFKLITAFVFNTDGPDSVNLMNHEYDEHCLRNDTVMASLRDFKTKYDKIKTLMHSEVKLVRRRGFGASFTEICEAKRDVARTMTDCIQPIANFCVGDEKIRKEFVLNTLLLLETTLDFICGMNQTHFEDIYEWHSERCLSDCMQQLQSCQRTSFDLFFWERTPEKLPTVIRLINGAICK